MKAKSRTLLAGTVVAVIGSAASADMVMVLDDVGVLGLEVIIIDNAPAGTLSASGLLSTMADPDPTVGVIEFAGAVPGSVFDVNTTIGISKPTLGSAAFGKVDLTSINVSGTGPGTLSILLTDTDFFNAGGPLPYVADFGGTTDGIVGVEGAVDTVTNGEFSASSAVFDGPLGPGSFSTSLPGGDIFAGLYSMSLRVDISHSAGGDETDLSGVIEVIPGPGGLAVAGIALLGLSRRRRRQQ